jgi:hypothetical protein
MANGQELQWFKDLAENKQDYKFSTWEQVAKAAQSYYTEQNKLKTEVRTTAYWKGKHDIDARIITTDEQVNAIPDISVAQKYELQDYLLKSNAAANNQSLKIAQAQKDIQNGTPGAISAGTKDVMFDAANNQQAQVTGKPVSLFDMANNMMGLSQFPTSGMQGVPLNTNSPKFDSILTTQLTSGDPVLMAQAGLAVNHIISFGHPNMVNLSGQALAVASKFNTLITGTTPPEEAAVLVNKEVLHATDTDVAERRERFRRNLLGVNRITGRSKLNDYFAEDFGTEAKDFETDAAFQYYKQMFAAQYIYSNSEDAARKAAKYSMRSWGTSKYFPPGLVAQPDRDWETNICL